ncbi:tetratricopeptide repeat protein [Thalassotalea fusca]
MKNVRKNRLPSTFSKHSGTLGRLIQDEHGLFSFMLTKQSHLIFLVPILFITVVIYANTLDVPLLFDDISSIEQVTAIYEAGTKELIERFRLRTLTYLTFKANYLIHGLDVKGYHIVNIIIHMLAVVSVYCFTLLLCNMSRQNCGRQNQFIALATAMLFAIHPLQTQAVTYIVQRTAALAGLFYFLTLSAYLAFRISNSYKWRIGYLVGFFVALACALLTKQNTYTLPLTLLLLEFVVVFNYKAYSALAYNRFWLFMGVAGLGTLVIYLVTPEFVAFLDAYTRETQKFSRLAYLETQLYVVFDYVKLFFIPVGQQVEYIVKVEDGDFTNSVFYVLGYLLVLIGGVVVCKRRPLIGFAVLFFFIVHSIESGFIPISDLAFEHRTYIPNWTLCLFVALLLANITTQQKTVAATVCVVLVVTLAVLTFLRNEQWRDPELLYTADLAANHDKPRIHQMLGKHYMQAGQLELALESFANAYQLVGSPDEADNQAFKYKFAIFNNYVATMRRLGKFEQAIVLINETIPRIKQKKYLAHIYSNLGFLYIDTKQYDKCEEALFMAHAINSQMVEPLIGLGTCFALRGEKWVAKGLFERARLIEPDSERIATLAKQLGIKY